MMNLGLKVTVNSDDPAYFGGQLNKNFIETQKALQLTKEDIFHLCRNSFEYSLLNDAKKTHYIKELEANFKREKEYDTR